MHSKAHIAKSGDKCAPPPPPPPLETIIKNGVVGKSHQFQKLPRCGQFYVFVVLTIMTSSKNGLVTCVTYTGVTYAGDVTYAGHCFFGFNSGVTYTGCVTYAGYVTYTGCVTYAAM